MHIIHITNNCNRGGANHVLLPIIEELVDKDIKFTLAYIQGPELLKNEFNSLGVETILLGKNPIKIFLRLFSLIKNNNKSQLVFHTHLVQAGLVGRFIGLLFGIPVITTRHYEERSKKNNLLYIMEDLSLRFNSFVIAISNSVKDHLVNSKYISKDKCIKVYNPLDKIFLDANRVSTNSFNITFVGRLHLVKGISYLIDAFAEINTEIPNAKLFIIGRDDGIKKQILEKIKKHPYKNKIFLLGFLKTEDIKKILSKTSVYVQPSLNEGLGIAAIEAMAMQCPCVFTNVGGLGEIADNEQNALLVPPKNSKKIFEAVLWHYKNRAKSKAKTLNARNYIIREFSPKLIADKYYMLYKQILGEKCI